MLSIPRQVNLILRLFFRFDCETIILLKDNSLFSIQRQDIHSLMSDLQNLRTADALPLKKIITMDELLEIQKQGGIQREEGFAIALINQEMELVAQLGREEIIQLWNQLQNITSKLAPNALAQTSAPQTSAEQNATWQLERTPSFTEYLEQKKKEDTKKVHLSMPTSDMRNESQTDVVQEDITPPPTTLSHQELASLKNFTPLAEKNSAEEMAPLPAPNIAPEKSAPTFSQFEKKERENLNAQKQQLQILTLSMEALPIPMMACSTGGQELFLNHDWEFFSKQKTTLLETVPLLENAKQKMVSLAKEDNLDIHSPLEIESFSAYNPRIKKFLFYKIFLRPIRVARQEADASEQEKTIGYLFYILPNYGGHEEVLNLAEGKKKDSSFLGRTLPDILADKEKEALLWAYQEADQNQSNAAMLLGIPRQTYAYKFHKHFTSP